MSCWISYHRQYVKQSFVSVGRRPQDRRDHRLGGAAGAVHRLRAYRTAKRAASRAGFFRTSPSGDRETPSAAEAMIAAPTMRVG